MSTQASQTRSGRISDGVRGVQYFYLNDELMKAPIGRFFSEFGCADLIKGCNLIVKLDKITNEMGILTQPRDKIREDGEAERRNSQRVR